MKNSPNNPIIIGSSTKQEGAEIVKFVDDNHIETKGFVFPRIKDLLLASAEAGHITTVRDKHSGELLSMSSIYILGFKLWEDLPPPRAINAIINRTGPEAGVTAELGTVIKKLVDNDDDPKGYNRLVHFGLPPLRLLRFHIDLQPDIFVTEVHHLNRDTVIFIQDGRVPEDIKNARLVDPSTPLCFEEGSPLYYPQISKPHDDLYVKRAETSPGALVNKDWNWYRIPVKCLVPLAETLKQVLDQKYIGDLRTKDHLNYNPEMRVHADFSQLQFRGAGGKPPISLDHLLDFILYHRKWFESQPLDTHWRTAANYVNNRIGTFPVRRDALVNGVDGSRISSGGIILPGQPANSALSTLARA